MNNLWFDAREEAELGEDFLAFLDALRLKLAPVSDVVSLGMVPLLLTVLSERLTGAGGERIGRCTLRLFKRAFRLASGGPSHLTSGRWRSILPLASRRCSYARARTNPPAGWDKTYREAALPHTPPTITTMNTHRSTLRPDEHQNAEISAGYHDDSESGHAHGHGAHMLLMLLVCVAMFAAVFLLAGSASGSLGWLPWLFLLLCPLLHLFMHRNHGSH